MGRGTVDQIISGTLDPLPCLASKGRLFQVTLRFAQSCSESSSSPIRVVLILSLIVQDIRRTLMELSQTAADGGFALQAGDYHPLAFQDADRELRTLFVATQERRC